MVRQRQSAIANRKRQRRLRRHYEHPSYRLLGITPVIPKSECHNCGHKNLASRQEFDEHGYPLPGRVFESGTRLAQVLKFQVEEQTQEPEQTFRFLDLPPEIRNRIYELVVYRQQQPVCVSDKLLQPSEDLKDARKALRECYADVICLPCQLHLILRTGHIGLSRANLQLHREMAFVTYTVNTFSLHNLYYLQMFLRLIGPQARKSLRSLRFTWALPEEEARSFKMFTSLGETYLLLVDCSTLSDLSVDMNVENLNVWKGSGRQLPEPRQSLNELPYLDIISKIRGLKNIKISWKIQYWDGMQGMEDWARALAGHWRLPRGSDGNEAVPVDAEGQDSQDGKSRFIRWSAAKDSLQRALRDHSGLERNDNALISSVQPPSTDNTRSIAIRPHVE